MSRAKNRGKIIPSFIVKCGAQFCDRSTTIWVETLAAAELEFTSRGWGESAVGWVCPECNPKINADPLLLVPMLTTLARSQLTHLRIEYSAGVAAAKINENPRILAEAMTRLRAVEDELRARGRAEDLAFTNYS